MLLKSFFLLLLLTTMAHAQKVTSNVSYVEPPRERGVLDIYAPDVAKNLPVVFWIRGGGWETGDKADVAIKPRMFNERGFVFVSTNYRLLPDVDMGTLIRDVAQALGWVHTNIAKYGGDPNRIFIMGHSAGAQLAAILCIDERYLNEQRVPFAALRGCVPVDGDTYDIPAIIAMAELRQALHHLPQPTFGHRVKFGSDPEKHVDFSAVTHVAKGKGIPPFLILYFTGNPDVTAQARRLTDELKKADVPARMYGAKDSNHNRLNDDLGKRNDPVTVELFKFLDPLVAKQSKSSSD
jgi:arylformamidase